MTPHPQLERLSQRAYRHALEDGIADIVIGFYTLIVGLSTQRRVFMALAVVYLAVLALAWQFVRQQYSSRRIGYAELTEQPLKTLMALVLAAGVVTMGVVAAITLSAGKMWNLTSWPNWAPALTGLVLAGGFLYAAMRSGLRRYYGYGTAPLAGSLFFWLFPFGPRIISSDRLTLFLFALAGVILLTGLVVLVRFVRTQPVVSGEDSDGR